MNKSLNDLAASLVGCKAEELLKFYLLESENASTSLSAGVFVTIAPNGQKFKYTLEQLEDEKRRLDAVVTELANLVVEYVAKEEDTSHSGKPEGECLVTDSPGKPGPSVTKESMVTKFTAGPENSEPKEAMVTKQAARAAAPVTKKKKGLVTGKSPAGQRVDTKKKKP